MQQTQQLNEKQLKFVELYLATGDATQSYIDAGYGSRGRSASNAANRLLSHVGVKRLLQQANNKAIETACETKFQTTTQTLNRIELTAELVLDEMRKLAFLDPRKVFRPDGTLKAIHELDDDTAACVSSLEIEEDIERAETGDAVVTVVRTTKVKFWDKRKALTDLGKRFNLWGDESTNGAALAFGDLVRQAMQNALRDRLAARSIGSRGELILTGDAGVCGVPAAVEDAPAFAVH